MDWFTLLLIFIFFVLPLIQQIAEARRRSQDPPDLEEGAEEWPPVEPTAERVERAEGRRPPRRSEPREGAGWAEGWAPWPGAEPAPVETPADRTNRSREPARRVERTAADAPRVEPADDDVHRKVREAAEALRERSRTEIAASAAAPVDSPDRVAPTPVRRSQSAYARRLRVERAAPALNSPGDLRRAIVLKEILDRPVGLRQPGAGGAPP